MNESIDYIAAMNGWLKFGAAIVFIVGACADYVVKGVADEIWPVKPHIFEKSYEAINE